MKSRSSREKDSMTTKNKMFDNNYQSARQSQNNSKLANLLNLSQFNCHDGLVNKSSASFAAVINHKINKNRKSPLLEIHSCFGNQSLSTKFKENENCNQRQFVQQMSPPDNGINTKKTKRSKSSKRNILSLKKRDTSSMMSLESSKINIMANYGPTKQKKKLKKEQNIKNLNFSKNKNNQQIIQASSLNNSKGVISKDQIPQNFVANYPLSMSHSYIVFSEKDSSLNNTANILNKASKKLSSSNQNKVLQLQEKLSLIKNEHAALVIQKNWRGYLTRKLLQDYILNEQTKLIHRLVHLKQQKEQYQKFERMSPGCNKLWQSVQDQCSQIFQQSQQGTRKQLNSELSNPISHSSLRKIPSTLKYNQQLEDDSLYQKKSPVINQVIDESQFLQSILQHEESPHITCRQRNEKVIINLIEKNNYNRQECMNIQTQNSSRNLKKKIDNFTIVKVLNETVLGENLNENKLISYLEVNFKKIFNQKLQKHKKVLNEKIKNSQISFDQMLNIRNQIKKLSNSFDAIVDSFSQSVRQCYQKIQAFQNTGKVNIQQKKIQQQKGQQAEMAQNGQFEHLINKDSLIKLRQHSLFMKQRTHQIKQEKEEQQKTGSPISQYFTIELPTQELSPFKPVLSSGLQSLKTYLTNLHQQFLQEKQNQSQTSYLCKVLKKHSQIGPENMVERCLIQMLVEMLTCQHSLSNLLLAYQYLQDEQQIQDDEQNNNSLSFIKRWAEQLDKWELGPIQQVQGNMQQSANITQRNYTNKSRSEKSPLCQSHYLIEE